MKSDRKLSTNILHKRKHPVIIFLLYFSQSLNLAETEYYNPEENNPLKNKQYRVTALSTDWTKIGQHKSWHVRKVRRSNAQKMDDQWQQELIVKHARPEFNEGEWVSEWPALNLTLWP